MRNSGIYARNARENYGVEQMNKCPHCESTKGLYAKYMLYGLQRYYGFDGSCEDCMDNAYQKGGKVLYCQECDRVVCTLEDWEDMLDG